MHTAFPLLESSLSWGTQQKPALLSTRSAFEQMSHRQSALNFLLGDISAPANAWLTDDMSFLGSVIWKDAAIGQNKGAQPDPHILILLLLAPDRPTRSRHHGTCFPSSWHHSHELSDYIAPFPQKFYMSSPKKKLLVCSAITPQVPKTLWLPWTKVK